MSIVSKKLQNRKNLIFGIIVLFLCNSAFVSCGSSQLLLTSTSGFPSSFSDSAVRDIVVKGNVDLKGKTITLPSNSILDVSRGSIQNGTIVLNQTKIKCKDTRGLNCILKGTCTNESLVVNNERYGAYHLSVLPEGAKATLLSDVHVTKTLKARCSITGVNNPTIRATDDVAILLNIVSSGVALNDLSLEIHNDTESQKCYAIRSSDIGNLKFNSISVKGGSIYLRNASNTSYSGYEISNSFFEIDHSKCNQSFEKQNDAFEFRGLRNLIFKNNRVLTRNVTRVFKTPASVLSNTPCDNLIFENNTIISDCVNGKQVFDFFNYTRNVTIKGNHIIARGHTDVFENKSNGDTSHINVLIENNTIEYDYKLLYFNLSVDGDNTLCLQNNVLISTSSANQRESLKNDVLTTGIRSYDCNIRNINRLEISGNSFEGAGLAEGSLFYFENIYNTNLKNNTIDGDWGQLASFKGTFETVNFLNNSENRKSEKNSTPVVTFSQADVKSFDAQGNHLDKRNGHYLLLKNNAVVHSVILGKNSMPEQTSLFRTQDKSRVIKINNRNL